MTQIECQIQFRQSTKKSPVMVSVMLSTFGGP